MFKVLYHIWWIDIHKARNMAHTKVKGFCVRILVICPLLLLGALLFGSIFVSLNYIMASSDQTIIRELGHVLISILGLMWIVFALLFNFHNLKYDHLFNLCLMPWTLSQVYAATVVRSLCDKWFLFWNVVLLWWCFHTGISVFSPGGFIAIFLVLLFGLVMLTWIHVFRIMIDYSFHSRILKWTFRGIGLMLFVAANYASVYTKLNAGAHMDIVTLLNTMKISTYAIFFPSGLLAEILYSFQDGVGQVTVLCFIGLLIYLVTGLKVGYLIAGKTMEKTGGRIIAIESRMTRTTLMEKAAPILDLIVPRKYIPVIVQELAYLIRWNRVRMIVGLCIFVFLSYLVALRPYAPMMLAICPFCFCMARFMSCYMNKDGMGVAHYFLYPFRNVDIILSKNIALLFFQYSITVPLATIGFVSIWNLVSWQQIICLIISMVFLPIIFMATGNLVAVTNPRAIVRAFSAVSTPETTSKGTAIMAAALVSGVTLIGLIYLVPKLILKSETIAVVAFLHFAIISCVFYKWSLSRASRLLEREKDKILSQLKIC